MNSDNAPVTYRVVLIGSTEVGKTSLVTCFLRHHFEEQSKSTVGAVFHIHERVVDGRKYIMQLWDTAGQEKYRSLGPIYYREAQAALAVFDVANKDSFDDLPKWINDFKRNTKDAKIFIVGNKIDIPNRQVSSEEIARFATECDDADWFEASAKTTENVPEVFETVLNTLIHESKGLPDTVSFDSESSFPEPNNNNNNSCC